ncbi:MAG: undecaprenyldiphospho-muramoylpentapeptide beta-N-acetylglucosaminyltransferase [Clostridiales bacterium]|nr:undecaprenyldiphospho-muramoylpentapeptide beta-N-acetylglucosaminyltransferase [Clostridiales bacterium]
MKKTIVLTGGGTAGHIMPNLALLPLLQKQFDQIFYLGAKESMEEKIIKNYKNITFVAIPTTKLMRKLTIKNMAIPFKLISSICKTKKILKEIKPNVIFCKGGFVSVPVAIAGKRLHIPVISHESDLSMGLANKIILRFAKTLCVSFKNTCHISKKCIYTGSPIREQIFKGNKNSIITKFKFNQSKPTVLFFGGSLGSKNINNLVEKSLEELTLKYNVLHITGKNNKTNLKCDGYYAVEFAEKIEDFFALADIVVCRGGANSLFELLALKKPMLIIPLSKAESRGDQIENAEYFKKMGYAYVMQEHEMSTQKLLENLHNLNQNINKIKTAMSNDTAVDANNKIVEIIVKNVKIIN